MPKKSTALARVAKVAPTKETKSGRAIRLPSQMPTIDAEEAVCRPSQELIDDTELRLKEEAKNAPPPKKVLESAPMNKRTVVVPVEVPTEAIQGFLAALYKISSENEAMPILKNARVTCAPGKVTLEATDLGLWAIASVKAFGGKQTFEFVLPLERALNICKRLSANYNMVPIGIDKENIHFGNYSFPSGGSIQDYPKRFNLCAEEVKVAMPASYLESIMRRVEPAMGDDIIQSPQLMGIHLDFRDNVAVATDGHRMHLLKLPQIHVEASNHLKSPPRVTIPSGFFSYLIAVVNRDWVGISVSEKMLVVAGEDYGMLAKTNDRPFPPWKSILTSYDGFWVLDKKMLLETLKDAQPLQSVEAIKIASDNISEGLIITAQGEDGEVFTKKIGAKRQGNAPLVKLGVNPDYLRDAVTATAGGLVRLGFSSESSEVSRIEVRGEDDDFIGIIMPCTC